MLSVLGLNSISASDPAPDPPCSRTTAAAVRLLPTPSAVAAVSFAKDECTHSNRRHRARSAYQQSPRSVMAVQVLNPTCASAQAPVPPHKVARSLGSVRLLTSSSRSAPGAVIKIAPSAWPSSAASLATSVVSDACHLDGLIDAPGQRERRSRREESMVPGATGAKESARVGHAHP